MTSNTEIDLGQFFPYQLTQLQSLVSDAIADIYANEFELSRQQWRVLATLGQVDFLTAKQIGAQTNLDKMSASRAITKMLEKKLLKRKSHSDDKRSSLLTLTSKGLKMYQRIVPQVLAREKQLLSILTPKELNQLKATMEKLANQAVTIVS